MIKGRKGIAVETLVRTIIMVILVVTVFIIAEPFIKIAFNYLFGGSSESFHAFVLEINENLNVKSKQAFIELEPNTAVIGFSKTAKEFRCFGCGLNTKDVTSYFRKPEDNACSNTACACLCSKGLILPDLTGKPPFEMKCEKPKCESLSKDLFDVIEHKNYLDKLEKEQQKDYSSSKNAKWVGGFLYDRRSIAEFISNGLPQVQMARFTVTLTQDTTPNGIYVAVCPGDECTYSMTTQTGTNQKPELPSDICQIMFACYEKKNTGYNKDIYMTTGLNGQPIPCDTQNPVVRQINKEDCEKVQACIKSKINQPTKCEDEGSFYQLSFS